MIKGLSHCNLAYLIDRLLYLKKCIFHLLDINKIGAFQLH